MTTKKVTTPTTAAGSEVTAERIRAILDSPDITERVLNSITNAVGRLYVATEADTLPDGPEITELEADMGLYLYRRDKGKRTEQERAAYSKLVALVERHEPKDVRLARLLLARVFPTDADREAARDGGLKTGGIIDHASTLADELNVTVFHPDILPHALPIIIRAARAVKARGYRGSALRLLLQKLEKAAGG